MERPPDASAAAGAAAGPRTIAAFLRDTVAMPAEVAARLSALDGARHPTLSQMRAALGLGLDLSAVWDTYHRAPIDFATLPADSELAARLDALYYAITGPRVIRARITSAGPVMTRAPEPIAIREGERLALLVIAENETDENVECSAESRGQGVGTMVEARRTGAGLLDVGAVPAGSYLLPVMIVAGGHPSTIDLPIESAPSGMLSVHIVDDETGEPAAARVYLTDEVGPAWPDGAAIRRDRHRNAWFHADSGFSARIAGRARLRVVRGMEYEPEETSVAVREDAEVALTVQLRRWSHMAATSWRSGDIHVHLHYGGEYELTPEDAALAQRAEDVHFLNMMVANEGGGWILDTDRFAGKPHALGDADHILQWGEEYRNNFYGHLCMYGITELVPPIYSGFEFSAHPDDWPPNAEPAAHASAAGGTVSYAHPVFNSIDLDRVFEKPRTVEAKELPVDAALGRIHAVDIMSYPSDNMETSKLWYRLLNCGLRLAATAGTDTFMNTMDGAELLAMGEEGALFSSPPAGARVYVRIDGGVTTESWCEGVRRGRTFVTNAAMLDLTVDGRGVGDEIEARSSDVLHVIGEARSYAPVQRLELIVNGEAVASAVATDGGRHARIEHQLTVTESCWIALRATGGAHETVLDDALFAHTSPIYVAVGGAPAARAADATYFVEWIERLIAMAREQGRYASDEQRELVVALFREGQAYYRRIVARR